MPSLSRMKFKRGKGTSIKDLKFKRSERRRIKNLRFNRFERTRIKDLKFRRHGEEVTVQELISQLHKIVPTPELSQESVRWERVKLALKLRGTEIGKELLQLAKDNQEQNDDVSFEDTDVLELLPDNSDSNSESSESTV